LNFISCVLKAQTVAYTKKVVLITSFPLASVADYFCLHELNNKCSAVAEMADRLATIDMGQRLGEGVPLGGAGFPI